MTIALPAETVRRPRSIDLSWPILMLFAAVLCVLILLPMSWLVYYSLVDRTGAFTLENFTRLVSDPTFVDPLITTGHHRQLRQRRSAAWSRRRWAGWWRAPTCRCGARCGRW